MVAPALAAGMVAGKSLAALKALYGSKHFITALIGAGYFGGMGVEALGQAGERGLAREQIGLQATMGKASAEATKRGVKESRANTKKYIDALLKAKKEEAKETRDIAALHSFTQSQDRQMALVLQAIQAIGQRQPGSGSAGMLGVMRGGF